MSWDGTLCSGGVQKHGSGSHNNTGVTPGFYNTPAGISVDATGAITAAYQTWSATPTYPVSALVIGSNSKQYRAVFANQGNDPTTDGGTNWTRVSLPPGGTSDGQVPIWNNTSKEYAPGAVSGTVPTGTDHQILVNNSGSWTAAALSGDAAIANTGALTLVNTAVSPGTYGDGTHSNTLSIDSKGRVTAVSTNAITGVPPGGSAGGDLSGTYPNPGVAKINGVTLGTTTATAGNILIGSGSQWGTTAVTGDITITASGVTSIGNSKITFNMLTASTQPGFAVELMNVDAPSGTGALSYEWRLPQAGDGSSATWTLVQCYLRVATTSSSGTPTVQIEYSTGTGIFSSAGNLLNANLGATAGTYQNNTASFAQTTLTSGYKVRVNVIATGTGTAGWSVMLQARRTA